MYKFDFNSGYTDPFGQQALRQQYLRRGLPLPKDPFQRLKPLRPKDFSKKPHASCLNAYKEYARSAKQELKLNEEYHEGTARRLHSKGLPCRFQTHGCPSLKVDGFFLPTFSKPDSLLFNRAARRLGSQDEALRRISATWSYASNELYYNIFANIDDIMDHDQAQLIERPDHIQTTIPHLNQLHPL